MRTRSGTGRGREVRPVKVIIATDGSEAALEAARAATRLLRGDAHIEVVAVIAAWQDPMEGAGGFAGPVQTEEEADDDYRAGVAEAGAVVAATASVIDAGTDAGVSTVVVPSQSPPGQAVVDLAVQRDADVIVLGAERPGFFERLFSRSVADEVVNEAPCPVLVVPHRT